MTSLIPESGILRMWCDLYEPKSEAPVEGHLGAAISLLSAAIGYKAPLTFVRNTEPCTVNIILEGQSALGRKTTTANTARELARRAVDPSADDPGLLVHQIGHTSDAGLLELIAPKDEAQARKWDTITPPGHLLVWDEFGSLLGDPGQNRKGGDWLGRVRTTILNVSNGWHSGSKTRSSPLTASRCSVSILATMTREELEQRVSTGLLHDGFLGRFALIRMTQNGKLLPIPPQFTPKDLHDERSIIEWLQRLAFRREAWGDPFTLLTPDAVTLRTDWYTEHRTRLVNDDDDLADAQAAAFGRIQALAMKVATVHAVSQIDDPSDGTLRIEAESVAYGQAIADLCLDEITSLAALSGPTADQYQGKIISYLERHSGTESATKRDLMRHVKFRGLDQKQRWAIVEQMHPDPILIETATTPGPKTLTVRLTTPFHSANGASSALSGDSSVTDTSTDLAPEVSVSLSVTTDTHIQEHKKKEGDTPPETVVPVVPVVPADSETWLTIDNPDQEAGPF